MAVAIDRWHAAHGPALSSWLQAVGELEALGRSPPSPTSIRRIRFRPSSTSGPVLDAEALAHPLIAEGVAVGNDVRLGGDGAARAAGRQRLEHVRQEHAAARHRHQRRAGAGRGAGPRRGADAVADGDRRDAARRGLAAGGHLALLRRDPPHPRHRRSGARSAAAAVSARRDPARHQLARPPHRRGGDRAVRWSRPARSAW